MFIITVRTIWCEQGNNSSSIVPLLRTYTGFHLRSHTAQPHWAQSTNYTQQSNPDKNLWICYRLLNSPGLFMSVIHQASVWQVQHPDRPGTVALQGHQVGGRNKRTTNDLWKSLKCNQSNKAVIFVSVYLKVSCNCCCVVAPPPYRAYTTLRVPSQLGAQLTEKRGSADSLVEAVRKHWLITDTDR